MSTKIYTGMRLDSSSPDFVLEKLKQLSKLVLVQVQLHVLDWKTNLSEDKTMSIRDIDTKLLEMVKEYGYDNLSVSVFFKDGYTLFIPFGGYQNFMFHIKEIAIEEVGFREYGYWNNTDPLDDISEEEWEERKKDWDFLGVPSEDGFSYQLGSSSPSVLGVW